MHDTSALGRRERLVSSRGTIGLISCATGGLHTIRHGFVQPALDRGWDLAVTVTPTASQWLSLAGEHDRIAQLTGYPVRDRPRLPHEPRPHPELVCCVVAPASANTVAKLALGIADNQALNTAIEAIGSSIPVIMFPQVNLAHTRHPAWEDHLARLEAGGVQLVYGQSIWQIHEPRQSPPGGRPLPWAAILDAVDQSVIQ